MRKELTGYAEINPVAFMSSRQKLEEIKRTDRTVHGFVKVLKIIESDSECFEWNQSYGYIPEDWTQVHDMKCTGCIGALLAWFFGEPEAAGHGRDYNEYVTMKGEGAAKWAEQVKADMVGHARRGNGFQTYQLPNKSKAYKYETGVIALAKYLGLNCAQYDGGPRLTYTRGKPLLEDLLEKIILELSNKDEPEALAFQDEGPFGDHNWDVSAVTVFEKAIADYGWK